MRSDRGAPAGYQDTPEHPALLAPPAPPPPDIAEAPFQQLVVDLARWFGWTVMHNADSRKTAAGIPDLLLLAGPTGRACLWRELKAERGRVKPAQLMIGALLRRCGQDFAIWRPSSWDAIVRELTGREEEDGHE